MAVWKDGALTNDGLALQAKMVAGSVLTITRIVSGAGVVPVADLQDQTAVTGPRKELSAEPIVINSNAQAEIPVLLENNGVTTAYTAYQIGFYAMDPDKGEILYFISQDATGEPIPTETDSPRFSVSWTFIVGYGNASQITIIIDPKTYITYETAMDLFAPRGFGLGEEKNLITNTDLNTLVKNGWYSIGSGCTNLPAAVGSYQAPTDSQPALLRVETSGTVVYQYFYPYTQRLAVTDDSQTMTGYHRINDSGFWYGWAIVSGITGRLLASNTDITGLIQPGTFSVDLTNTTALSKLPSGAKSGRYNIINTDHANGRILQQVYMVTPNGSKADGNIYLRVMEDNRVVNPSWGLWASFATSSGFANKIIPEIKTGTSATNRKIALDGITSYDQLYDIELTVASAYLDFNGGLAVTFEVNSLGAVPVYFLDPSGGIGNESVAYWATNGAPYKITYRKISSSLSVFYVYATPYVRATQYRYGFVKTTSTIDAQTDGGLVPDVDAVRSSLNGAGGTVRQDTPPSNTRMTWIDSSDEDKPKYYNGSAWVPFKAVWG